MRHALALLFLVAGCNGRPAAYDRPLALDGPHKVGDQLLWVDGARGLTFALDPAASPPKVKSVRAGHRASFVTASPSRGDLLILTAGHEPTRRDDPAEAPTLTVVHVDPAGPTVTRTYPLPAAFDRLSVSDDGTAAVAFQSGAPHDDGAFFSNPNGLAILDLTADPGGDNPTYHAIRSLGSSPLGVFFSPPLSIPAGAGNDRTLAVVMSKNYLTLLDVTHRKRKEITVPLQPIDSTDTLTPVQVAFVPGTATAFVRADGSTDVFALTLEPRDTAGDDTLNDFLPHINQPSAGKVARDMILYTEPAGTFILTANDSQDVALIDASTSQFSIIPLGVPVDAILPIPAADPKLAILFSRSSPQPFVHFLDLTNLSANLDRNLTRRTLASAAHDLVAAPGAAPGDGKILVIHDDARTVISILDLSPRRTDTPILGRVPLESFDFTAGGYLVGTDGKLDRVGILDLVALDPYDFHLDYLPKKVLAVGQRVVVDHGAPEGLVTILPPDPTAGRDQARVLWGFFLDGVLDQPLKD